MQQRTVNLPFVRDVALALIGAGFNAKAPTRRELNDSVPTATVQVDFIKLFDPRFMWTVSKFQAQGVAGQGSQGTALLVHPMGFDFVQTDDGFSITMSCATPEDAALIKHLFLNPCGDRRRVLGPNVFSAAALTELRERLSAPETVETLDEERPPASVLRH